MRIRATDVPCIFPVDDTVPSRTQRSLFLCRSCWRRRIRAIIVDLHCTTPALDFADSVPAKIHCYHRDKSAVIDIVVLAICSNDHKQDSTFS